MPLLAVKSMQTTMAICIPLDRQSVKSCLIVCLKCYSKITPFSLLFFIKVQRKLPRERLSRSVLAYPMSEWPLSQKKRKTMGCFGLLLQSLFSLILRGLKRLSLPSLTSLSQSRYSSLFLTLQSFQWQPPSPKHRKQEPTSMFLPKRVNSTNLLVPRSTFSPLKLIMPKREPPASISLSIPLLLALKISPTVADASPRICDPLHIQTMIFCLTQQESMYLRRSIRWQVTQGSHNVHCRGLQVWF